MAINKTNRQNYALKQTSITFKDENYGVLREVKMQQAQKKQFAGKLSISSAKKLLNFSN